MKKRWERNALKMMNIKVGNKWFSTFNRYNKILKHDSYLLTKYNTPFNKNKGESRVCTRLNNTPKEMDKLSQYLICIFK